MDDLDGLVQLWTTWLQAEGKSTGTIRTYTAAVRLYAAWCAAEGRKPELDRGTVAAWIASILQGGGEPATALVRHRGLRRFSAWCADEGEIESDPLAGMHPPRLDRKVVPKLSDAELSALLQACEGKTFRDRRDEAIVRLAMETGARAEELLCLDTGDLDMGIRLATIRRGKGGKGRLVPFSPQAGVAIGRYLRLRRLHALAGTPPLWLGERSRGFGYHALHEALKARARTAGIEDFHIHRLRHTAASRWLRAGGSEGGLMAVAGWSSRAMLDRYVQDSAMERAAEEARSLSLGDI